MIPFRVGIGTDSHRFSNDPEKKLILGGVHIPDAPGLDSHSDGDFVYHAVTDALIGAAGLDGDIGSYFSDKDEAARGQDSGKMLSFIWGLVKEAGFKLGNLDVVITSQTVRIAPVREDVRGNLAGLLEADKTKVTVKAKTAEKMGALGRGEGLACQAVVLLYRD